MDDVVRVERRIAILYHLAVDVPELHSGVITKRASDRTEIGLGAEPSHASPEEHVDFFVTDRTPAENVQDPKVVGDARPRISIFLSKDALEVVAETHFISAAWSIPNFFLNDKIKRELVCSSSSSSLDRSSSLGAYRDCACSANIRSMKMSVKGLSTCERKADFSMTILSLRAAWAKFSHKTWTRSRMFRAAIAHDRSSRWLACTTETKGLLRR